MPLDTSIYGNIQPVKPIDVMGAAQGAIQLGNLGMQQQQMQRQMQLQNMQLQQQQSVRDAYAQNTDPTTGQLNQQGFLATIGKNPMTASMVPEQQNQFSAMAKNQAEAKAAQADASNKLVSASLPVFETLDKMTPEQQAKAGPNYLKQLESSGVPIPNWPKTSDGQFIWDQGMFNRSMANLKNSPAYLEQQATIAKTNESNSNAAMGPLKRAGEQFGSRSPNATLTDQYNDQAKTIRPSATAMNQMIDNYKNPSPQGDASLILNAFKIKFPTAPDVNSLEELSKSQSATDTWKQLANKAISGGLDTDTRNNLMRDGISTYRANYNTLQGIKQRIQARQNFQGINDPTMTAEPAMDQTYKDAMDMQKQVGPYVAPPDRPGIMGSLSKMAQSVMGTGPSKATAADKPVQQYRPQGAPVSADELAQYATVHKMKLSDAKNYLEGKGYVINK